MKVATFNANSVRSRLPLLEAWLRRERPDVLCLQETKVQDPDFPEGFFRELGYHVVFRGQKVHAGVAIASLQEPKDVRFGLDDGGPPDEARLVRATVGGFRSSTSTSPRGSPPTPPVRLQARVAWAPAGLPQPPLLA